MTNSNFPLLKKIPFLAAAALLIAAAAFIASQSLRPFPITMAFLLVAAIALGALLAVIPFILEYKSAVKSAESGQLADAVAQIQKLQSLAAQISGATAQWQDVQTAAGKTAAAAQEISASMAAEVAQFTEFLKKSNDAEKNSLRLEVEKSRRAEGEWLQVVVRLLDHVFALHQAGARSGQPELAAQLDQFQNACRDAVRRIGLTPFHAAPDEPFHAERHKILDAETAPAGSLVGETLAPGFTYQGRLLRPALVKLQTEDAKEIPAGEKSEPTVEPTLL